MFSISKVNFTNFIEKIIYDQKRYDELDKALKQFAPSDFTGIAKTDDWKVKWISGIMGDEGGWIEWWLCETDYGEKLTQVWEDNDPEDSPSWDIKTPGDLYDFLVIHYYKSPNPMREKKAQDNGFKYALQEIKSCKDNNFLSQNEGWEERNALFQFLLTTLTNHYLLEVGANSDVDYSRKINLICSLEEE